MINIIIFLYIFGQTKFFLTSKKTRKLALFTCKIFCEMSIVPILFVFDQYCSIMDELGSKDSSRQF